MSDPVLDAEQVERMTNLQAWQPQLLAHDRALRARLAAAEEGEQDANDDRAEFAAEVVRLTEALAAAERDRDAAEKLCGQVQEWYTAYRRRNPEGRVVRLHKILKEARHHIEERAAWNSGAYDVLELIDAALAAGSVEEHGDVGEREDVGERG
jgi:hypothetical protein